MSAAKFEPWATGKCGRVVLEVDQPSGSTNLLEADQATGSTHLRAHISCERCACVSISSCYLKPNKLPSPPCKREWSCQAPGFHLIKLVPLDAEEDQVVFAVLVDLEDAILQWLKTFSSFITENAQNGNCRRLNGSRCFIRTSRILPFQSTPLLKINSQKNVKMGTRREANSTPLRPAGPHFSYSTEWYDTPNWHP